MKKVSRDRVAGHFLESSIRKLVVGIAYEIPNSLA